MFVMFADMAIRLRSVICSAVIVVAACQSKVHEPSISLEEARKTVATFDGNNSLLPPRQSDDVLRLFDNWPDLQSAKRSQWVAEAEQTLSKDASLHERITTLYGRAAASRRLGRSGQELSDLRAAIELADKRGHELEFPLSPTFEKALLRDAAWAEFSDGQFARSLDFFERSAQTPLGSWQGERFSWTSLSGLAYVHAYSGDLENAKRIAKQAKESIRLAGVTDRTIWVGVHRSNPWRKIYSSSIDYTLLQAEGRWSEAEPHIRNAIGIFEDAFGERGNFLWAHGREDDWLDIQRAELTANLVQQGRIGDAEIVLRDSLRDALETQGKYSKSTAILLSRFHEILAAQGRYSEAQNLAARVLEVYRKLEAPSNSRLVAEAQFNLAESYALQGRWSKAQIQYLTTLRAFEQDGYSFRRYFANNPSMLITLLEGGDTVAVAPLLKLARERSVKDKGIVHYDSLELDALEAMLAGRQGDRQTALRTYREIIPELIEADRRARISGHQRYDRRWRLLLILKDYIGILERSIHRADNPKAAQDMVSEAFRIAAFAQSHAVDWELAKSAVRNQAADPKLAEIIRLEQDAKLQIESINARLADALAQPSAEQNRTAIDSLKTRLVNLGASQAALRSAIEERFSGYSELITPEPPSLKDIQTVLRPGEAVLSFIVGDKQTYVWAFGSSGRVEFRMVGLGRAELAAKISLLRAALEPTLRVLGDIPEFDVKTAHELYTALLWPAASGWRQANHLIVLADGPLAYLPFPLLVTELAELPAERAPLFSNYRNVSWLTRSHSVTILPSATSLKILRMLPTRNASRRPFIGFGDPVFNAKQAAQATQPRPDANPETARRRGGPASMVRMVMRVPKQTEELPSATIGNLPRLSETAEEVRQIAMALKADPTKDVYTGLAASEARVKTMKMSDVRVLAFATHGLVPGDLNGLTEPALALTPSHISGESKGNEDGLLKMGEILNLKLNADWVVLSACNTGANKSAGAGAVSGLGRAFFYAGARALLVTNWPVETNSAKLLTTTLFRLQSQEKTLTRSEALRLARHRLIDGPGFIDPHSGKQVFTYSHPIFWAAFTLNGDGGI